ncbi:hypothetical protein [Sinorhizobium psoraleae]|uniref:Terminase small subunit n=1 Tax=Sinorhizobium psoraleae TaxID=520838 RepID=A0ABT4KB57_9HYPH|nr:hypothetical protein [Sinorhizobium psoraleae]MCZ4089083.1 hypothetical protein [Sinorhizobium psoraleae]
MRTKTDNDFVPPKNKRGKPRRRAMSAKERAQKTSPEHIEHLKKVGFQKGREKTGGRVATPPEVKEFLGSRTMEAAEFFVNLMNDDTQPIKERRMAAQWILESHIAKAPTQQEIKVDHTYSIADMLVQTNQIAAEEKRKMIDITPKPLAIEEEKDV